MAFIGNTPISSAFVTDQFNGTGSQTAFTMSLAPANTASILVSVTGVLQDPSTYSVSGTTLTFSQSPPAGTGNISVRYLGIPASSVVNTAYRTVTEFTATSGQTLFTPPSYTVGFINVYRNGVRLGAADFTATNGTTVTLALGASLGDLIVTESFYVSSVLNAIPATAGAVNSTYIADNAITTAKIAPGAVIQADLAPGVAGNGPAFSAYATTAQTITSNTYTKIQFNAESFDTANCFDSTTNYRFTPTIAGYYQVNVSLYWNGSIAGESIVALYKNGSFDKNIANFFGASSAKIYVQGGSVLLYMNGTTDYIEIYGFQNSGGNISTGTTATSNFFQACLVRAA